MYKKSIKNCGINDFFFCFDEGGEVVFVCYIFFFVKFFFDKKGNVMNEDDFIVFIKVEGGVICVMIFYVFFI